VATFVQTTPEQRPVELPCNQAFASFLTDELVPWAARRTDISDDPARTTLAGASYGALAASFGALQHPERFGNVLAQSGSYWWEPADNEDRYLSLDERNGGWLPAAYAASPKLPIRFYLDVGTLEASPNWTNQCTAVRGFRDVLRERGYDVTLHEFTGGHAYECWRYTFANGLLSLVGTEEKSELRG
jgi:enterochelin esterase family protein